MAFIQYSKTFNSITLKDFNPKQTTLKIPLTPDSLFLLQANNKYQVYQIRTNEMLYKGQIPKQFAASQYIEALGNFRSSTVLLANSEASICKVNYRQNIMDIHKLSIPEKVLNIGSLCVQFKILDQMGEYLLGCVKNLQNMSVVLFVYDLVARSYSNFINLGTGFFNCVISNLSQEFTLWNRPSEIKIPQLNFVIVGEEEKKICYKYIHLQTYENSSENHSAKGRIRFILKQSVKRSISYDYFARGVYLSFPHMYIIANSKDGPTLVRTNIEQNENCKIDLKTDLVGEKGVIRQYLGFVDGNMLFSIQSIVKRSQQIYTIAIVEREIQKNKSGIICNRLIDMKSNEREVINRLSIIRRSLDGYSFHRYNFEHQTIREELMKENPNFESRLQIEMMLGVPKKYLYREMVEQLQFPQALIHQIVSLL